MQPRVYTGLGVVPGKQSFIHENERNEPNGMEKTEWNERNGTNDYKKVGTSLALSISINMIIIHQNVSTYNYFFKNCISNCISYQLNCYTTIVI